MTSMKRRDLLRGLGGAAAVALIAACSAPSTTAPTSAPAAGGAPTSAPAGATAAPATVAATGSQVAITYWGGFTGHNADVQTQLVDRFNQSQKDVKVTLENQNDYATIANKLTAAIQAKNAPEVVLLSDVWWFKFYLSKALQPLDDLMKAENINPSDYVDVFYKETVRAGKQVVLPFARSTPIFYYNKDAWAKAGLPERGPNTWDEFINDFRAKTEATRASRPRPRRRGELLGLGLPGRHLGLRRPVLGSGLHHSHPGAERGQGGRNVAIDGQRRL